MDDAVGALAPPHPDGVALIAIGGYGRGDLSLYSDVDLMVLHALDDPSDVAAAVFRPLWDAGLRVGHAVRTVREAAGAAKESFDTQTTLLTGRLVTGDEELFTRLMSEVVGVTRARPLRRYLVSEERERRRKSPYLLMSTDVKNGRGGLRTLQGFEWERRREDLIGRFSTDHDKEEAESRETLLQVRNALHAVAGRAHDMFSPDYREQAARWLGEEPFDVATRLVEALETVDLLAARRWPEVIEDRPRRAWSRPAGRRRPGNGSERPGVERLVALLSSGEQGRVDFDRSWREGALAEVLPEWEVVRFLPQLAPFHEHPVASHLWRTVDEMMTLMEGGGHYAQVAAEVGDPGTLVLTGFLHDIGKGHGGDHSETGANTAEAVCRRMGLSEDVTRLITETVRHHLLLALTATRRDLDDPAVIDQVVATVGDLRTLQVLYLLTVADSRATGPAMWSPWKETLLRTLFIRCAARLEGREPATSAATREEVMALAAAAGVVATAASHLDGMPGDYLRGMEAEEVLWHLEVIAGIDGVSNIGVTGGDPAQTVVVAGWERPGFRRKVAEVLAANGIDVLEARLLGRSDGLLVDIFRARDDRIGGAVRPEKWDRVKTEIEAGLSGELDTTARLAGRASAYPSTPGSAPVARGSIDPATGDLLLTVRCADRIGRLAEILSVLEGCDLEIRLAKIDSRGGEVVDTFHVARRAPGFDDIGELTERIAAAISR
jgi:[protein-PII] uridylyltransferase